MCVTRGWRSALRPRDGDGTRVLFMGDSFIQGYDDANTIPQRAYEWIAAQAALKQPLIVLTAAYSSYSPAIFTVQAKQLLPILRPAFLVIDVDETDFFDDAVRYRQLVVRDEQRRMVAVGRTPELLAFAEGCAWARRFPLYLGRLTTLAYYQARLMIHDWMERRRERPFTRAESSQATAELEAQAHLLQHARRAVRHLEGISSRRPNFGRAASASPAPPERRARTAVGPQGRRPGTRRGGARRRVVLRRPG